MATAGADPYPDEAETATSVRGDAEPPPKDDLVGQTPASPEPPPDADDDPDTDVWAHAVSLDDIARRTTGKTVSNWRLRTDLHIGPHRAQRIRDQLLARRTDPWTPAE